MLQCQGNLGISEISHLQVMSLQCLIEYVYTCTYSCSYCCRYSYSWSVPKLLEPALPPRAISAESNASKITAMFRMAVMSAFRLSLGYAAAEDLRRKFLTDNQRFGVKTLQCKVVASLCIIVVDQCVIL